MNSLQDGVSRSYTEIALLAYSDSAGGRSGRKREVRKKELCTKRLYMDEGAFESADQSNCW